MFVIAVKFVNKCSTAPNFDYRSGALGTIGSEHDVSVSINLADFRPIANRSLEASKKVCWVKRFGNSFYYVV